MLVVYYNSKHARDGIVRFPLTKTERPKFASNSGRSRLLDAWRLFRGANRTQKHVSI
jgi:hypothetical protein